MRFRMLLGLAMSLAPCMAAAGDDPGREAEAEQKETAPALDPKPLGVEEFMKSVDEHRGQEVLVEGVVSAVTPEDGMIALIDLGEFEHCGVTSCAPLTLPVRWMGEMPELEDLVRVEGLVREADGKLVFAARELTRLKEPRQEGK